MLEKDEKYGIVVSIIGSEDEEPRNLSSFL